MTDDKNRIDLDVLERKAQAVRGESGDAEWFDAMGEYRGASSPSVMLALIGRIRELEAEVDRGATLLEASSDRGARKVWAASLRDTVAKGAVLP